MSALGEVLAWKFDNAPGIRTREDGKGGMEIFDWPAPLGPMPTRAQIVQWTADYAALPVPKSRGEALADTLDTAIDADRWAALSAHFREAGA